jgi:hypothetical protein
MKTTIEIKKIITDKLQGMKRQLEMSEGSLINCRWIMVVNEVYTVSTDENSKTCLSLQSFPKQFSDKAARQIEEECTFRNNKNEILKAKKVLYKEYYKNKVKELEEVLKTLNNLN